MRIAALVLSATLLIGAAPDRAPERAAAQAAFETLRLSAELARAGSAAHDPLLLIAAARLRTQAAVRSDAGAAERVDEWLNAAEAHGADDPRIAGLVADVRAMASKGRADGPRVTQQLIRGGERRSFVETFRAGQPAVVYVEGDGDTHLTLTVGSACRDVGPGDVKICSWTPTRSERVTVEIGNAGSVQNRVIMGMN